MDFPNVLRLADYLGINLVDWQLDVVHLYDTNSTKKRFKIALRAPNESGKSSRIIPVMCVRHLQRYPSGKVVITSKDSRQISDQVWPALKRVLHKFPQWKVTNSQYTIDTPGGGRLRAFTTADPGRAEGFHSDENSPLLIIVDEAKTIDPDIFQAIDRCSYNVLLYISSPDRKYGPFYEAFTSNAQRFHCFHAGLNDCRAWISQEKIDDIIATFGVESSFTKSALEGEFMDDDLGETHIIEPDEVEAWLHSEIGFKPGITTFGLDYAQGGDNNAIVVRHGNSCPEIVAFQQKNTAIATQEIVGHLYRMGYDRRTANLQMYGDVGGAGKNFNDTLRMQGFPITDFNFGGKSALDGFKNDGTRIWYNLASMIRQGEIRCPPVHQKNVKMLFNQLVSRRRKLDAGGKAWMETKQEMRERGIASPDIADAFALAFHVQSAIGSSYMPFDDAQRQQIATVHGWDYTPANDDGYPGRGDLDGPCTNDFV